MESKSGMPAIVWLRMTDYTHGWLQYELGGEVKVKNLRVVCVQHLPGAREILRMPAEESAMPRPVGSVMSGSWKNCMDDGLRLDPDVMARDYGMTKEAMALFVPVEMPRMSMTRNGVLRPWALTTSLSPRQATALQRLLRGAFWDAVEAFDRSYAGRMGGRKYPAVDMVEAFCEATGTPDLHVAAIRREWQRRCKRARG